ncbi:MAG: hypothetical protein AAGI15_09705 [Pseudomonadota bacterium]
MSPTRTPGWRALAVALAVALVILIVAVLPAERGIDPTGIGDWLGLTALHRSATAPPAVQTVALPSGAAGYDTTLAREHLVFELGPFESVEYKYRLRKDEPLLYRWQSSGDVIASFHGHPEDGDPEVDTVGHESLRGTGSAGTFHAPFAGLHGWFFQNRGSAPVAVTLDSAGFYTQAIEYRDGFPFEKAVPGPATMTTH